MTFANFVVAMERTEGEEEEEDREGGQRRRTEEEQGRGGMN